MCNQNKVFRNRIERLGIYMGPEKASKAPGKNGISMGDLWSTLEYHPEIPIEKALSSNGLRSIRNESE